MPNFIWRHGQLLIFALYACISLFLLVIYIAKKLYEKLKVVIFFEISIVIRIQPNFKKIHQNYTHC
jgi:hypothetical protein